ncbi:MAG: hypothetical protein ACFFAE_04255, partial [Candidatus Hodarchaeota archaeon]
FNIRKEASNALQEQVKQISAIFSETTEVLQKHMIKLKDDFSQSISPIKGDFKELADNFRKTTNSSESMIQQNIEKFKIGVHQVIDQFEKYNEELIRVNLSKLEKIPNIFDPYSKKVAKENVSHSETTNNDLEKLRREYNANLWALKDDVDNKMRTFSESVNKILDQFETDSSNEEKVFNEKIERIDSLLDNVQLNVNQKKSNFLNIRQGYEKIDESMRNLFSELENKLINIESLIKGSIDDIQSRKLFKGKEEFISNLTILEEDRKSILQSLKEQSSILGKVDSLNSILNETENEIVQATEIGINEVRKILDEEVNLLSYNLQDIKQKIGSEFRTSVENHLQMKNQDVKTQIDDVETVLNKTVGNFNQQLNELNTKLLGELFGLVQQTSDEFENNLKSFFEEKSAFDLERSGFKSIMDEIDTTTENSNLETNTLLEEVSDLENSFNSYISGLNTFTASFTNTQLDELNSILNRTEETVNTQIMKINQKLEQEISALTFSIKEMKQRLNKISELSRLVGISDIESSFLSSDLVIGETAIIMMLRDLTLRAKASLTILMPRPELQTLVTASKLPTRTRINIIGDFKKVPESTLKKILSSANVRLKQLDTVDFWGCIRDAEELLVCPEPKHPDKEGLIGVITTNENLVELFSQELMTYTTRSREIIL